MRTVVECTRRFRKVDTNRKFEFAKKSVPDSQASTFFGESGYDCCLQSVLNIG